jgi:hypothetical protein
MIVHVILEASLAFTPPLCEVLTAPNHVLAISMHDNGFPTMSGILVFNNHACL